ncbi:MAG: RNA polymerase sigma factor [Planctomycetota bacterium]
MNLRSFFRKHPPEPNLKAANADGSEATDPLTRYRGGEMSAFDEMVESFAPRIVRVFRRFGADPSSADDLAQEVFVRLYKTNAHYESRGRLEVYLYRVARNVWIDWKRVQLSRGGLRSLDVTLPDFPEPVLSLLAHPAAGPLETLTGRDAARVLSMLLKRLPEGERLVLELSIFEGLRYSEISAALEIPEGTVKSRVFNAVRRLRVWASEGELSL